MTVRRPSVALFAAMALSLAGTRLTAIAIPWFVLTQSGDPILTGVAVMAELLPYVLAKALGGPLIDRAGARTVAVLCDGASMAVVAAIPLADLVGLLNLATLLPILALLGSLRGPSDIAKQAMIPDVAEAVRLPLERLTGLAGMIDRLATTVGAGAGGALIAFVGPLPAMAVCVAAFGGSALAVAAGLSGLAPARALGAGGGYRSDLRDGWRFLSRDRLLMGLVLLVAATNLLDQAYFSVLLPSWIQMRALDADALGMVLAAFAVASILGSALAAAAASRLPRRAVFSAAFVISGGPRFFILAADGALPGVMAVSAVCGLSAGFVNPVLGAVMLERIPADLRGRVMALAGAAFWSLVPFGGLFGGVLIGIAGLSGTLVVMGAVYTLLTLAPALLPRFGAMDR